MFVVWSQVYACRSMVDVCTAPLLCYFRGVTGHRVLSATCTTQLCQDGWKAQRTEPEIRFRGKEQQFTGQGKRSSFVFVRCVWLCAHACASVLNFSQRLRVQGASDCEYICVCKCVELVLDFLLHIRSCVHERDSISAHTCTCWCATPCLSCTGVCM